MKNYSERLVFVHDDGSRWYPAIVKDRISKLATFRVARPGSGSNRKENTTFIDPAEEDKMHQLVLDQGWLVRCRTLAGGANMFAVGKRVIREVILDGNSVRKR